jgi:N-carbamoylputrescine amidase
MKQEKKVCRYFACRKFLIPPTFCPGQDAKWYASAETIPGPTVERMQAYAKKYNMVIIVPIYEKEQAGVLYNTAAVIDADGKYLGKYRKNHIPHTSGFWEKFFFKPGNLGYRFFKLSMQRWVYISAMIVIFLMVQEFWD